MPERPAGHWRGKSIQEGLGSEHTGGMAGSLQSQSDGALVIAIGRLKEDALAEVYRRHAGAVYGLGRRILGDSSLSEEMVQEVFLRLWNEPERFDPIRDFFTKQGLAHLLPTPEVSA